MAAEIVAENLASAHVSAELRAEFEEFLRGCAINQFSDRAKLEITGKDRVRWLNGMVSNNIRDLPSGRGVYAFLLNPQGHILGDLYAYNRGESFLVDTARTQVERVREIFGKYIIMDKVTLNDVTGQLTALGVTGPQWQSVLRAIGIELPALDRLQFAQTAWQGNNVTVVHGGNFPVENCELWVESNAAPALLEVLQAAGGKRISSPALELLRIASGIPRYGHDIRERDLPQETGQIRALDFSKGCYIGQEIVERIRSRGAVHRKFSGFHVDGPPPLPGTKIQADGKDAGEITSAAVLPAPNSEVSVALGYIRQEAIAGERPVMAGDAQLTLVELPFKEVFSA